MNRDEKIVDFMDRLAEGNVGDFEDRFMCSRYSLKCQLYQ